MMAANSTCEIFNRFVDLLLIVGIDENTGLVLADNDVQNDEIHESLDNIFFQEYKAEVLASVSATKAVQFHPCLQEDPFYPPLQAMPLDGSGEHILPSVCNETRDRSRSFTSREKKRNVAVTAEVMKRHLSRTLERSNTEPELPLSVEMIQSVPSFCFPDYAKVRREKPDPHVHFFVFTDDYAKKTYATCVTFYLPYIIHQDSDTNTIQLNLDVRNCIPAMNETKGYLPQCCIFISKYPYFYAMKECLSRMVEHIQQDVQEMFTFAKDYTYLLTMVPVPPAGNVAISLSLFQMKIVLYPSEWAENAVIDIPLHLVFLSFSIDDIINIFTCILTEQRIVFLSSTYGLLTVVMESFLHFIQPFKWRYTYVPIICQSHLDLLEAPGTFMMGCHARHAEVVEEISGLVVVNIDDGSVMLNEETELNSDNKTIPTIPNEPMSLFKKVCKHFNFYTDLTDVQRLFSYNPDAEREHRMKTRQQFNTQISFVFLELMVNLFRGVLPELMADHKLFNQQVFIESVAEESKDFYRKVFKTDMFKKFLEERFNDKSDFWSDFEAKTRPYAKKARGLSSPQSKMAIRPQRKSLVKQVSVSLWPSSLMPPEYHMFKLPTLDNSATYIDKSIYQLAKALEECPDLEARASYLYLRGMFLASKGKFQAALEDLYTIASINARLLATELVQQVFSVIPRSDLDSMRKRRRSSSFDAQLPKPSHVPDWKPLRQSVSFHLSMPDTDLMMDDFVKMVRGHGMADEYETIVELFHSLVKSENSFYLDKETFENFFSCYQENKDQCQKIEIHYDKPRNDKSQDGKPRDDKLQDSEYILCLSQLIKTDYGMGRIGLTDKRLFFLKDVSNAFKEIIKLRDIRKLEKQQMRSLLKKIDVLIIQNEDGSIKFTSSLKDDRDCWYLLIEEMRSGRVVAEAIKDTSAIHQAMLNVELVKAIIRSSKDQVTDTQMDRLCYFTKYVREKRHQLPQDTTESLQHRVDPNFGEQEKKTVISLLFIPELSSDSGNHTDTRPPRLWCCLSNGKVKAFDLTTWELETSVIPTAISVTCLAAVGENQVWVGSAEIFIIDMETMTCNKTLMEHRDVVVSIQPTSDGRFVYSASIDGLVIKWEVQTLKCVNQFKLADIVNLRSLKLCGDSFWCGTVQAIVESDLHGKALYCYPYNFKSIGENKLPVPELSCFEITDNEVWAGCRSEGLIIIWDRRTQNSKTTIEIKCDGISTMLLTDNKLWVGTKGVSVGYIYIYDTDTHHLWKSLKAHNDSIRSLCCAQLRYVMSGAGSKDGKIAVWLPNTLVDSDKIIENLH